MPDVSAVDVDFNAKTATITMKEGKKTDRNSVETALQASGYGVVSFAEK